MSKATSKKEKADVADTTVLENTEVENTTEVKTETVVDVVEADTAEKQTEINQKQTDSEKKTEKNKADKNSGLPFTVKDGVVEVVSVKRAGKSVIGASGEIIKFDNNGVAKVKLVDAMHFAKISGFEFK